MADARIEGPFTDTGTGAYDGPTGDPAVSDSPVPGDPTGAVSLPDGPVVTEDLTHEGEPLGAASVPDPEAVYEWPAQPPQQKQVAKADASDKAVKRSKTK